MRKFSLFLVVLLVFGAIGSVLAADFKTQDSKKPTVKSEIQRGYEAFSDPSYDEYGLKDKDDFVKIIDIISINKQQNLDTDAFYLGIYFRAWRVMGKAIEMEKNLNNQDKERNLKAYTKNMIFYYKEFRRLEKEFGINDAKFFEVVGISKKADLLEDIKKKIKETEAQLE